MTGWIDQVISPSFAWVNFLTLDDIILSRTDLLQLSRLTNLGVLTVGRMRGDDLDDNIIRAWGRAASEVGAFSRFRILVCSWQHSITERIFTYFEDFPELGLYVVDRHSYSSAFMDEGKKHNWRMMKDLPMRINSLEVETPSFCPWYDVYSRCVEGGVFDDNKLDHRGEGAGQGLAVLDLSSRAHGTLDTLQRADTRLFARTSRCTSDKTHTPHLDRKRTSDESSEAKHLFPRKRTIRTSRQRHMGDMISEFAT